MHSPSVWVLAEIISGAVLKDELSEGCDISAGMFGPELSKVVKSLAIDEVGSNKMETILAKWKEFGGKQYGPNIESVCIPLVQFPLFLSAITPLLTSPSTACGVVICPHIFREDGSPAVEGDVVSVRAKKAPDVGRAVGILCYSGTPNSSLEKGWYVDEIFGESLLSVENSLHTLEFSASKRKFSPTPK